MNIFNHFRYVQISFRSKSAYDALWASGHVEITLQLPSHHHFFTTIPLKLDDLFNIKMQSYHHSHSHYKDKTVSRSCHLCNENPHTLRRSLFWTRALINGLSSSFLCCTQYFVIMKRVMTKPHDTTLKQFAVFGDVFFVKGKQKIFLYQQSFIFFFQSI